MGFGIVIVILAVILFTMLRLGRSIFSTRRLSGQGQWSPDSSEIGGIEPGGHHTPGHHDVGGHHDAGGHHFGGGGGDFGGGHHG